MEILEKRGRLAEKRGYLGKKVGVWGKIADFGGKTWVFGGNAEIVGKSDLEGMRISKNRASNPDIFDVNFRKN